MTERESFERDPGFQSIERDVDEMVERMQSPDFKSSTDKFFDATPEQLQESIKIRRTHLEDEAPIESS